MEGDLAKKTSGGKWKTRYFRVADGELSWLKSDNKTTLFVKLTAPGTEVRDIKVGLRKFAFAVTAEGREIHLAASGEAEKAQWIMMIERNAGIKSRQSNLLKVQGPPQSPGKIDSAKAANIANVLGLGGNNASGGNAVMSDAACEKLKSKLAGTAMPMFTGPTKCSECDKTVYKVEEISVKGVIMHKTCFRCRTCHRELTLSHFHFEQGCYYCDAHYDQLFGAGGEEERRKKEEEDNLNERKKMQAAPPQITFAAQAVAAQKMRGKSMAVESPTTSGNEPMNIFQEASPALNHSANLARPTIMRGKRNDPTRVSVAKMLPKAEIKDRSVHEFAFKLDTGKEKLVAHASSLIERNKWMTVLANSIHAVRLKRDLENAQKSDMRAAIQAQVHLEAYTHAHETSYHGYLHKLSVKSQRNWKKRYFNLYNGQLHYYTDENAKKAKSTIALTVNSKVTDFSGKVIEAEGIEESIKVEKPVEPMKQEMKLIPVVKPVSTPQTQQQTAKPSSSSNTGGPNTIKVISSPIENSPIVFQLPGQSHTDMRQSRVERMVKQSINEDAMRRDAESYEERAASSLDHDPHHIRPLSVKLPGLDFKPTSLKSREESASSVESVPIVKVNSSSTAESAVNNIRDQSESSQTPIVSAQIEIEPPKKSRLSFKFRSGSKTEKTTNNNNNNNNSKAATTADYEDEMKSEDQEYTRSGTSNGDSRSAASGDYSRLPTPSPIRTASSSNDQGNRNKPPAQIRVGNAQGMDLIHALDPLSSRTNKAFMAKGKAIGRKSMLPTYNIPDQ